MPTPSAAPPRRRWASSAHYCNTRWNFHGAPDTELAYPGAINSAGDTFATHFKSHGARHKASTCNAC
ncbi:hypothetical protein [Kitasatospora paranensis]|uniref:hypothetical protein n=1 Tax=Kitasatospora paranensis TaxID=258053 RepID=UPI0031E8F264